MEKLKQVKVVVPLIVFVVICLFLIASYGTEEYRLKCTGNVEYIVREKIIIEVARYRPIVFWRDADGVMVIRGDGRHRFYFRIP